METTKFEDIESEFMRRISRAVYCVMATVDPAGHPRTRIMHPVWEGSMGWAISWPASPKTTHLANNPHVSLAYIAESLTPVYVECSAAWRNDDVSKRHLWDLCKSLPHPLGFDPEPHYGSIHHKFFGALEFVPSRIMLAELGGESRVWRASQ